MGLQEFREDVMLNPANAARKTVLELIQDGRSEFRDAMEFQRVTKRCC